MFIGEFSHSLDIKGRLAVPAKFRDQLLGGAIITRGLDRCLFLFTHKDWEILAEKLIALPLAQANSRAFVRLMLSGASDAETDSQGRILVPDYLRKYASLEKNAKIT
ncbi:MAG: division/cell wall cluster transcriptional repressor MraZ, partial [Patescibacteria group bacterium]|nr:division/cell wall cluster transcriptional repressor MraZ [Patescibacteria group bacterium]